jgi:hypothetical protein
MLLISHPEAIRMHGEIAYFVATDNRHRLFDSNSVCQFLDVPLPQTEELPSEQPSQE